MEFYTKKNPSLKRNTGKSILSEWHQEHKTPISRGGSDNISNIVISCSPCNWKKRDRTEKEFKTILSDTKTSA